MNVVIRVQGDRELERKLLAMDRKVAKKTVRTAVRNGAKVTQKAIKENAKSIVGGKMGSMLSKNTVIRAFKKQRRGSFGVSAMLKPGVEEFVSKGNYIPNAIEFGHAAPGDAGGTKVVAAMPFIRPAQDATKDKALRTIENEVARGIKAVWNK